MGLHISEVEPLGSLDRGQTQALAARLWEKSAAHTGLTPAMIDDTLARFTGSDGQSPKAGDLAAASWFQPEEVTQKRGFPAGRISLSLGRFLHLGMDLELGSGTGAEAQLRQRRRIRLGQDQYYDHPRIGVIAVVHPVEVTQPSP